MPVYRKRLGGPEARAEKHKARRKRRASGGLGLVAVARVVRAVRAVRALEASCGGAGGTGSDESFPFPAYIHEYSRLNRLPAVTSMYQPTRLMLGKIAGTSTSTRSRMGRAYCCTL